MSPLCCRPHVDPDLPFLSPSIQQPRRPSRSSVGGIPRMDRRTSCDSSPSVTASRGRSGNEFLQASTGSGMVDQCGSRLQNNRHSAVDHLSSIRNSFIEGDVSELKINDLLGNGISGILYKWVNYGKGWRPRWFVLQDGVLSYYKIHGPDRIDFDKENEKGTVVIGEESIRRMSQRSHGNGAGQRPREKPIGEVHLKVATIWASQSDEKRFSIFSGTKSLRLRAETQEDRRMWMEALNAVKDMFLRTPSSELIGPVDNFVASTVMLRQRLQEEGINDIAIQDIEQIMRTELYTLQMQVVALKQKQSLLLNTLRQLETEKGDLEDAVFDESQRH